MKSWHSLILGDGLIASAPQAEIEEAFQHAFASAGSPRGMAVFTRLESEGRLHCEVTAYFSPAAWEVAQAFDAEPCPQPQRLGLSLLAGDSGASPLLFSD